MRTHDLRITATLAATLSCLYVLSPAPAQAQGAAPVIEKILDGNGKTVTRAPQGGVIQLVGRNFHACPPPPEGVSLNDYRCKHPGLDVTIAGTKALILASTGDSVTVVIPSKAKPTPSAEVVITYKGRVTQTALEIVDGKAWKVPGGNEPCRHPRPLADPEKHLRAFKITRFLLVRTPAGDTFVVEGIARVPDGMQVQLELGLDGTKIPGSKKLVPVENEAFRYAFSPYPKTEALLPGIYSADVLFELGRQSKRRRHRWAKTLTDEEQELYGRIQRRELTRVGPERYRSYCGETLEFFVNTVRR